MLWNVLGRSIDGPIKVSTQAANELGLGFSVRARFVQIDTVVLQTSYESAGDRDQIVDERRGHEYVSSDPTQEGISNTQLDSPIPERSLHAYDVQSLHMLLLRTLPTRS